MITTTATDINANQSKDGYYQDSNSDTQNNVCSAGITQWAESFVSGFLLEMWLVSGPRLHAFLISRFRSVASQCVVWPPFIEYKWGVVALMGLTFN